MFAEATAKHDGRLNVKDLDRIWAKLRVAREEVPEEVPPSSESEPPEEALPPSASEPMGKGFSPLDGRKQVQAQLASPEGAAASERAATGLAGVAEDDRLLDLIRDNKPSFKQRIVQHGVASTKFYAGLLPLVGTSIKIAAAVQNSKELRALKSLRDDFVLGGEPNPLLSECIDRLEDRSRVKRDKSAISAALDGIKLAVSLGTGGVAAPATEAASHAVSHYASEAIGKAVSVATNKAADLVATKGAQARAEKHVEGLQAKSGQVIGSGDQAARLSDYRAVRALLLYLGPADQSEAIRGDTTISGEKRTQLLKQEHHRLALKQTLGSGPEEDLTVGLERTEGDKQFIDQLAKRGTSGRGEKAYVQIRQDGDNAPSPLRALWMLEGWIGTDNELEAAVTVAKEKVDQVALQVRTPGPAAYGRLQEY